MADKLRQPLGSFFPGRDDQLRWSPLSEIPGSYKEAIAKLREAKFCPRKKRLKLAKEAIALCHYLFPAYKLAALTELDDPRGPHMNAAIGYLDRGLEVIASLQKDGKKQPFEMVGHKCALLRLLAILRFHTGENEKALQSYRELLTQDLTPKMARTVKWELSCVLAEAGLTSELDALISNTSGQSRIFYPYSKAYCTFKVEGFTEKFKKMLSVMVQSDPDTCLFCLGLLYKPVDESQEVLESESVMYVAMMAKKWLDICKAEPRVHELIVDLLESQRSDLLAQISDVRNQAKAEAFLSV